MVFEQASSNVIGFRETNMGPYPSPIEAPQFISAYLSAISG